MVQRYETDYLSNIAKHVRDIRDRTYTLSPATSFVIRERGKVRAIRGEHIDDRVVKHVLCDEILLPAIKPRLIHDNGASLKGKGVAFTRRRLLQHLRAFYRQRGNNGYILLMDFSKFYDNIRHKELFRILMKHVNDPHAAYLIDYILQNECVDVSYMTPEQYAVCMDTLFSSLEYNEIPTHLKTGSLWMDKHLDIGDQLAQVAGIVYPAEIDQYVKTVKGVKYYARYMDDSYAIHQDKEFLRDLQKEITAKAATLGITINQRKTRIVPLSSHWSFLQTRYRLTATGRIECKPCQTKIVRGRRKMRKLAPIMTAKQLDDWFRSWYNANCEDVSKQQSKNLFKLLSDLEENVCIK